MSMKILLTNDDGIDALGFNLLVEKAKKYGEVVVVAPKKEQSAKSQAIDVTNSFECVKVDKFDGILCYTVDSTPTDCVRFAKYGLKLDFDYVFSGINKGYNTGEDILYSGTCGAVFEAKSVKAKAIAFSVSKDSFDGAEYFDMAMDYILKNDLLNKHDLFNVNLPANAKGVKITRQGGCNFDTYFIETSPNHFRQLGKMMLETSKDLMELDTACISNDYISITPMTYDRTDFDAYHKLLK